MKTQQNFINSCNPPQEIKYLSPHRFKLIIDELKNKPAWEIVGNHDITEEEIRFVSKKYYKLEVAQ